MTAKKKLYYILKNYILKKCSTEIFCDQIYEIFNLEIETNNLSEIEYNNFKELSDIASRFSFFEEDLKKYDCYYNENEIMKKAKKVYQNLKNDVIMKKKKL